MLDYEDDGSDGDGDDVSDVKLRFVRDNHCHPPSHSLPPTRLCGEYLLIEGR